MSADNWARCPNIARHSPPPTADSRDVYTFREDYEIYGAEKGNVIVRYSGHCTVCSAGMDFEYSQKVPNVLPEPCGDCETLRQGYNAALANGLVVSAKYIKNVLEAHERDNHGYVGR